MQIDRSRRAESNALFKSRLTSREGARKSSFSLWVSKTGFTCPETSDFASRATLANKVPDTLWVYWHARRAVCTLISRVIHFLRSETCSKYRVENWKSPNRLGKLCSSIDLDELSLMRYSKVILRVGKVRENRAFLSGYRKTGFDPVWPLHRLAILATLATRNAPHSMQSIDTIAGQFAHLFLELSHFLRSETWLKVSYGKLKVTKSTREAM